MKLSRKLILILNCMYQKLQKYHYVKNSRQLLSKLAIIQLSVKTILLQQFVVLALLDDVAVADDQDQISVADSAQPMGDYEASFTLH